MYVAQRILRTLDVVICYIAVYRIMNLLITSTLSLFSKFMNAYMAIVKYITNERA